MNRPYTPPLGPSKRPQLTADTVVAYIDWALANMGKISGPALEAHLRGAEMVVRTKMGDAQAKATQHTLVESGVIDPPPAPSGGGQT